MGGNRPIPADARPRQVQPYPACLDSHVCYPIEPEQFWKLFLPSYREWVANAARGASFVHLWSEEIAWSGCDFWACPPPGPYFHEAFEQGGAVERFPPVRSEDDVRRLMGRPIADSKRPARPSATAS